MDFSGDEKEMDISHIYKLYPTINSAWSKALGVSVDFLLSRPWTWVPRTRGSRHEKNNIVRQLYVVEIQQLVPVFH